MSDGCKPMPFPHTPLRATCDATQHCLMTPMPLQKVSALSKLKQQQQQHQQMHDKIALPHCLLRAPSPPSMPTHASAPAGNCSMGNLPAQDGPTAQALLEATASSRAWQKQQRLHCVTCQPPMIMPATISLLTCVSTGNATTQTRATQTMATVTMATQTSFDGWPNAEAVLEATASSMIWQQHQMPQCASLQLKSPRQMQDLQIEQPQQHRLPSTRQQDCAFLEPLDALVLGTAAHVPQAEPAPGLPSMNSMQHNNMSHNQRCDMSRPDCSCNLELASSSNEQPWVLSEASQCATILGDGCMAKVIHSCQQQLHVKANVSVVVNDSDGSCQAEACLPKKLESSPYGVTLAAAVHDASSAVMKRMAAKAQRVGAQAPVLAQCVACMLFVSL